MVVFPAFLERLVGFPGIPILERKPLHVVKSFHDPSFITVFQREAEIPAAGAALFRGLITIERDPFARPYLY